MAPSKGILKTPVLSLGYAPLDHVRVLGRSSFHDIAVNFGNTGVFSKQSMLVWNDFV